MLPPLDTSDHSLIIVTIDANPKTSLAVPFHRTTFRYTKADSGSFRSCMAPLCVFFTDITSKTMSHFRHGKFCPPDITTNTSSRFWFIWIHVKSGKILKRGKASLPTIINGPEFITDTAKLFAMNVTCNSTLDEHDCLLIDCTPSHS